MAKFLVEIRASGDGNKAFTEYERVEDTDHDKAALSAWLLLVDRVLQTPALREKVSQFVTPPCVDKGLKLMYVHRCTLLA